MSSKRKNLCTAITKEKEKKVKTSLGSLKELFTKQQKNHDKINVEEGLVIDLLSDDEDDSLLCNAVDKVEKEIINRKIEIVSKLEREDSEISINESSNSETIHFSNQSSYLSNFKTIVLMVTKDPFYNYLFNTQDRGIVDDFINKLQGDEQTLYLRLYLRKHGWLRSDQISYPSLNHHMPLILTSLVSHGFISNDLRQADTREVLEKLASADLKLFAKSLKLNAAKRRQELIDDVVKHSKKQGIASFFKKQGASNDQSDYVKERACKLLGDCYRLSDSHHNLFQRIFTLAFLHQSVSDIETSAQKLIHEMMQSSQQQTSLPEYSTNKLTPIYPHREALLLYVKMLVDEGEMYRQAERKCFGKAALLYEKMQEQYASCMKEDADDMQHYIKLPPHLRTFTPPAAYVRISHKASLIYQSLKRFDEAVDVLLLLLSQPHFHRSSRGRWYDRASINLSFHLKRHREALELLMQGLADPDVRAGHRLDLLLRAKKIITMKALREERSEKKRKKEGREDEKVKEKEEKGWMEILEKEAMNQLRTAPSVTIQGQLIPRHNPTGNTYWLVPSLKPRGGGDDDCDDDDGNDDDYTCHGEDGGDNDCDKKCKFEKNGYDDDDDDETSQDGYSLRQREEVVVKRRSGEVRDGEKEDEKEGVRAGRVEEVAMWHYAQQGYTEAIHGEGMTLTTLFFLFAWEVIFTSEHPDTFLNPFQTHPLDLRTDAFYAKRKLELDALFAEIENSDSERLLSMAQRQWRQHHSTSTLWSNCELFRDCAHLQSLVVSLGGRVLTGVLQRMGRQMRFVVGGVPDLIVWNPLLKKAVFVEVKGPGDKLSSKQLLWIDFLLQIGAEVQVCHVQGGNPKRKLK